MRARVWLGVATTLVALGSLAAGFTPESRGDDRGIPATPSNAQPMIVREVLSGDTVVLSVDRPGSQVQKIGLVTARLLGIDSPNFGITHECYAVEAHARLSELLPDRTVAWVALDATAKDAEGRYLTYVWTGDGRFVNYELTVDGFVAAEEMPPNNRYWQTIAAGQASAVARLWGGWGECGG